MTTQQGDFRPTLYLLHQCPFCLKLVIYLNEADILDEFTLEIFELGDEKGDEIRKQLSAHFDEVSFPTAEVESGKFIKGSDELIAFYREKGGPDPDQLQLLTYYTGGVMKYVGKLFLENRELKEKLENA